MLERFTPLHAQPPTRLPVVLLNTFQLKFAYECFSTMLVTRHKMWEEKLLCLVIPTLRGGHAIDTMYWCLFWDQVWLVP